MVKRVVTPEQIEQARYNVRFGLAMTTVIRETAKLRSQLTDKGILGKIKPSRPLKQQNPLTSLYLLSKHLPKPQLPKN